MGKIRHTIALLAFSVTASSVALASDPKVVLITGTASGIGRATAEKLIAEGHIVYGGDIQLKKNRYLNEIGGHALDMDVTKRSMVKAGVRKILRKHGRIDVLVNNAGYGAYGSIEDLTIKQIRRQFDVNVFGYARLQKAVLPHMRARKSGRVILVSSVVGETSAPILGWYAASKHAVEGMADALRIEVAPLGIQVVKIQPGPIATNFQKVAIAHLDKVKTSEDYEALEQLFVAAITAANDRAPGPEVVADAISEAIEAATPDAVYRVATGDSE